MIIHLKMLKFRFMKKSQITNLLSDLLVQLKCLEICKNNCSKFDFRF